MVLTGSELHLSSWTHPQSPLSLVRGPGLQGFWVDTAAVAPLTMSSEFCGSPRLSEQFPYLAYFYVEKTACSREKTTDPRTSLVFLLKWFTMNTFWELLLCLWGLSEAY